MPFSRVAALAGLAVLSSTASAFPIANLPVSNDTFSQLSNQSLPQAERDALATAQVLPQLRLFFNQTTHAIEIETSDVAIQQSIPDSTIDDSCDHKVTSEGATAKGNVLNDTELSFGISNISWTGGVQVFADARLDSVLDISGDVKVELGKKVFGHCEHIAHKTVGLDVVSHGTVGLGLNFTASDAHVEKSVNGTGFDLVFDFECNTVGLVLSWNVQEVTANNCKLKILGIDILSYCGFIEKAVQKGVDTLSAKAIAVEAPKVAAKVEAALNTAIGGQVRIPLKL
eukprot:INCI5949.2.p1 GENE.INCI5949.2~~INCI5949.2.p1  ORF type:complete len:285 (-),score=64.46 INCI5949.2:165-1019(-)